MSKLIKTYDEYMVNHITTKTYSVSSNCIITSPILGDNFEVKSIIRVYNQPNSYETDGEFRIELHSTSQYKISTLIWGESYNIMDIIKSFKLHNPDHENVDSYIKSLTEQFIYVIGNDLKVKIEMYNKSIYDTLQSCIIAI